MAKRVIMCDIPQGEYMQWMISTQAAFSVKIVLKDDAKTYVDQTRTSRDFLPPIVGYEKVLGANLRLEIDITESSKIKLATNGGLIIVENTGVIVGRSFTYGMEDLNDNDYNDVTAMIASFKKKG